MQFLAVVQTGYIMGIFSKSFVFGCCCGVHVSQKANGGCGEL